MSEGVKLVAKNRLAYHEYSVLETYEAGISLAGTEVKSIRMKSAISIKESYVSFEKGEAWLIGARISPYEQGNIFNREPERPRRLLLHKREIFRLKSRVEEKGLTVVPLSVYFKKGRVKIELGLCRGKHTYDKRQSIKERESNLEMQRAAKRYK